MANSTRRKTTLGLTIFGITIASGLGPVAQAEGPFEVLDIVIIVDSSGGVTFDGYATEVALMQNFVENARPVDSRIGIIEFATAVYVRHELTDDQTNEGILQTIYELDYIARYSNMVGALEASINLFTTQSEAENDRLILLLTDGSTNPGSGGNGDVCSLTGTLALLEISTVIVGVGPDWSERQIECLVADPTTDIVNINNVDADFLDFDRFRTKYQPRCEDVDGDGYGFPGTALCDNGAEEDCDDGDPNVFPNATEVCTDGIDNDCDQQLDCLDSECSADPSCDSDDDGVANNADLCPGTPAGTIVDSDGRPIGDFDTDCDTDLNDYISFLQGFTGHLP